MEFEDKYASIDFQENFYYFSENIYTNEAENSELVNINCCKCVDNICTADKCDCLQKSGTSYRFSNINKLNTYSILIKDLNKPSFECNAECQCKNLCGNRLVQFGPTNGLYVATCSNSFKGKGLFTENLLRSGKFVCEYAGEVISEKDAKLRYENNKKLQKMNYIFHIAENFGNNYCINTFIDPSHYGNIGRFINHSCEPNCILIPIRNDNLRLCIFTNGQLSKGDEITYSYGENVSRQNENVNDLIQCQCNSKNCNKFLPFEPNIIFRK